MIEPASPRSGKKNILHGSTAETVLGKTKLAALTKPFLVHLKNGKVRALLLPLLACVMVYFFQQVHYFFNQFTLERFIFFVD